jgi:hypothetical protein
VFSAWRSSSSQIVKRILAEMVGIAFAALHHIDDTLDDLSARPVSRGTAS